MISENKTFLETILPFCIGLQMYLKKKSEREAHIIYTDCPS